MRTPQAREGGAVGGEAEIKGNNEEGWRSKGGVMLEGRKQREGKDGATVPWQ